MQQLHRKKEQHLDKEEAGDHNQGRHSKVRNHLTVRLNVPENVAKTVVSSILPEIDSDSYGRSDVRLSYDGALILDISSPDLHALRAAANTYLRWLDMCLKLAH